ncbi:MAG: acyl-CoA dehydrogenase [Actinomycetia bacterium]|nr:acyl-CoA dehydrogenase [Actinomycetes bacterium]
MELAFSAEDEAFRTEVREWLAANLTGKFKEAGHIGGSGREHEGHEIRHEWEQVLGANGWTCLGWPKQFGGRGATLNQQVIFNEEYVKADAPARVGHIGEGLIGPTLIAYGTPEQQARFLPKIVSGEELWCQGYSEPNAGSDLANVQTKAVLDGDRWIVNGQKVWTSLAMQADWVFLVVRTDPDPSKKHAGLSFLLAPMAQPGVEIRPIIQATGTSEFNEVFFSDAETDASNILGAPGQGWEVANALLGFERGVATLAQQIQFEREYANVLRMAQGNGRSADPVVRDRLAGSWIGLKLLRFNALRMLTNMGDGAPGPEASISKLAWANWHRALGELAIDVQGVGGLLAEGAPYELTGEQALFLFTRSDTIYGGSNEIQKNIIGERALGLPREPKK